MTPQEKWENIKSKYNLEMPGTFADMKWLIDRIKILENELNKIKDGGVQIGLIATVETRMIKMCDIAEKALNTMPGEK